jgi:hypothetical protein
MSIMLQIDLVCPYCGFAWEGLMEPDQVNHQPILQVCPGDEHPEACDRYFYYHANLTAKVVNYFVDASEVIPARPEPHTSTEKKR